MKIAGCFIAIHGDGGLPMLDLIFPKVPEIDYRPSVGFHRVDRVDLHAQPYPGICTTDMDATWMALAFVGFEFPETNS